MIDVLLQIGLAKLLASCVLAGFAAVMQRRVGHPTYVHRFWLLVLVALLLPAVVEIPVLPGEPGAAAVGIDGLALSPDPTAQVPTNVMNGPQPEPGTTLAARITDDAKVGLAITWLLGTALMLAWTLLRVLRFRHWLVRTSQPAPPELRDEVSEIGRRLGLARMPALHTTSARVSPMVCWAGGRVRIVVPAFLLTSLDRHELRAMLAHELAHVRRRDHLVRWVEWLACSAFWWNPVAWWARREVRAAEEASCDALGAAAVECARRDYARSLLGVLKAMATPPTPHTPVFASGVTSGGSSKSVERRLRMLVKGEASAKATRWVRAAGVATAMCLLPLGLVYCGTVVGPLEELEESPELPPISTTELIALVDLNRTDPRAAEMNELGELATGDFQLRNYTEEPSFSYWIFDTSTGIVGPIPLATAPVQTLACQLDPHEPDENARDEAMGACVGAMSDHFQQTGDYEDGNVCVVWGGRVSGWRGFCETRGSTRRDRVRGGLMDSPLPERVRINIGSTQSFAEREK